MSRAQAKPLKSPASYSLHDHVADRITRLADAMIRISAGTIKANWNIRHTDLRLLNVLVGSEGLSVSEISRRAMVDQAWTSRSLNTLESLRLVKRRKAPQDARLSLVTLTSRGSRLLEEVLPYALMSEQQLLAGIDERQLKALLDLLEANVNDMLAGLPGKTA